MTRRQSASVLQVSLVVMAIVGAVGAAPVRAEWPLWDGKESVADYARRAGIKEVQTSLDLSAGVSMKMTLIPAGKFLMGAREAEHAMIEGVRTLVREIEAGVQVHEVPRREVTISKPFYMGVYEVTREQFAQIMEKITLAETQENDSTELTIPVTPIHWDEAAKFCKKVSALTHRTVALPTEAQWEYACRAGSQDRFFFGDDDEELHKYANYNRNSVWAGKKTQHDDGFEGLAPVGSFKPNKFGLYDVHGNAVELVSDWMGDDDVSRGTRGHSYKNAGTVDPTGPERTWPEKFGYYKVSRGGSYTSAPAGCRCAARPLHGKSIGGFRVSMTLE